MLLHKQYMPPSPPTYLNLTFVCVHVHECRRGSCFCLCTHHSLDLRPGARDGDGNGPEGAGVQRNAAVRAAEVQPRASVTRYIGATGTSTVLDQPTH